MDERFVNADSAEPCRLRPDYDEAQLRSVSVGNIERPAPCVCRVTRPASVNIPLLRAISAVDAKRYARNRTGFANTIHDSGNSGRAVTEAFSPTKASPALRTFLPILGVFDKIRFSIFIIV
jgi:hypothetical protein